MVSKKFTLEELDELLESTKNDKNKVKELIEYVLPTIIVILMARNIYNEELFHETVTYLLTNFDKFDFSRKSKKERAFVKFLYYCFLRAKRSLLFKYGRKREFLQEEEDVFDTVVNFSETIDYESLVDKKILFKNLFENYLPKKPISIQLRLLSLVNEINPFFCFNDERIFNIYQRYYLRKKIKEDFKEE